MEQRTLRLGDLVDDYCPRERRVTNHVIVAMVAEGIRQTRCSTCQAEHEYKEARMPRKKVKTDDTSDLAGGVLVAHKTPNGQADDAAAETPAPSHANGSTPAVVADAQAASQDDEQDGSSAQERELPGAWIGHRPLIRASLPKTENDVPPPRVIPEFTMHQRPGRGFGGGRGFRPHGFGGHSNGSGGGAPQGRDGNGPDGNRAGGVPGGRSRNRRRHRGKPR